MIKTTNIDIEQTIGSLSSKSNTIEVGTLFDQAIAERIAALCPPIDLSSPIQVFCPDMVITMGKKP